LDSTASSGFVIDDIQNANASEDTVSRYNIDMKSGFRVKPGALVEEYNGILTRPESFDIRHPQEFVRPLAEELTGPLRPEPTDTFIATSIAPEDL
jgi:hypothetical protein